MNFFAFSSILIVIICSINSLFLIREAKRNNAILIWGFVTNLAIIWGIGATIFSTTTNYNIALKGWQIGAIASILAPIVHHHFVLTYLNIINKRTLQLLYTYGLIALIYEFLYPQYFFGELKFVFNQFYFISFIQLNNIPYFIHYILAHNILLLYSFTLLLNTYKKSKKENKNRHKYMILGSGIGWLGTHGDFLTSILHNSYPYLNILLAVFPFIITYAIIRHQLLDIKVVIKTSLVYTLSVTLITVLFIVLVFIAQHIFQITIGYNNFWITLAGVIIITLCFSPIRNILQRYIDKIFFKATPIQIAEENESLRREVIDKEKFKAVATLASNIVHELKNPLTALKTFHEYLPVRKDDPEFMAKFQEIGTKELDRLEKLSRELLDFAKPSPLTLTQTNINQLITETVDLMHSQAAKRHISLITNFDSSLLNIKIDKNKIKQALINLITNSIEAMPVGGIITIETSHPPSNVQITVSDTGCGISPEDLKHIFDPFFTKKSGGTGLGLAICYQIISEHKGKIEVESKIRVGSTFKIQLPISN